MESSPTVKVQQGLLRGKIETNCEGNSYYSFKGIPFAEPPIGRLRFKAPRPPKSWNGVLDATEDSCPSRSIHLCTGETIGSEDCLYLNIFTKQVPKSVLNPKLLRPVLFWIHPGAFIKGSNNIDLYGADILLTEDIVLVSINYRLGAIGSLGFTDPAIDVPGNNGLKDCVAALKWVQENISQFGGDPKNVTIFGESAGSVSCQYLCLSHMARGLFHRAICQSGSALASWACTKAQPEILAKVVGYTGDLKDQKAVYEYLLTVPVETLIDAQETVMAEEGYTGGILPWAPVVEPIGCPTEPNFITKHPREIVESGDVYDVPIIFGYNSEEGLLMTGKESPEAFRALMATPVYDYFVPLSFGLQPGTPEAKEIGNAIHQKYWGNKVPSFDNYKPFVDYCTDMIFSVAIVNSAKLHSKFSSSPVYLYRFDLDLPYSFVKTKMLGIPFPGCTHSEELPYLFSNAYGDKPKIDDSDAGKTIYRFLKLWTSYAKGHDMGSLQSDRLINTEWKPFTEGEENYLSIDLDVKLKQNPDFERRKFWEELCKKCNVKAI